MAGCDNCGGALEQTDDHGATNGGPFTEEYRCTSCGCTGSVSGESSEPPERWTKAGVVFGGSA